MIMLRVLAICASAALPQVPVELPDWLSKSLAEVELEMASVEAGRRIAAGASGVPLEARRLDPEGPAVAYQAGVRPAIAIDPRQVENLRVLDLELALARARVKARLDAGVLLVELEQAAEQEVLEYVLERAQASEAFGASLRSALNRAQLGEEARRGGGGAPSPLVPLPSHEPDRAAESLRRFVAEPDDFYWTIERDLVRREMAVRLSDLENFLWAYAERLDRAACAPKGRYCRIDGRMIPAALVSAARATLAGGGLDRVREPLAGFQPAQTQALRLRLAQWIEKVP